ncbi:MULTISPECIES: EipA family protein [unclassified Rhizobium]|uniref:DUF1134 domain-containing protein n=1 Tax=unclassified Rhizobium TaxID=2613769 RepID=UPI0010438F92|nr:MULTISPECIES: EipA family protein [unclassified Rhizobium]MBB3398473.1 hypothetical protein [Rhizobium sp. BK060]MBB4171286.1 hypothetical protein [Rhizobium sp. BK538]MBZ9793232.1 EipA family protein [Rhizobium sp. 3T7]TCM68552.1 hypothetical protein EV291_12915 [Rhizobium sp. BK068]
MRSHFLGRFSAICRLFVALTLSPLILVPTQAAAQQQSNGGQYSMQEIVDAGHSFFGSTSGGLAKVIEAAFQKYGLPNGYILGQEGSGAFIAGLTYGEGQLNTKNAGEHPLYWQGPSLGIDYGGQGTRVMMLVYDLPSTEAIYARFGGVSGQAFVIAGFGMTLLKNDNVLVVPIRTGVGARLGLNVGYLKVTPNPTWNPF